MFRLSAIFDVTTWIELFYTFTVAQQHGSKDKSYPWNLPWESLQGTLKNCVYFGLHVIFPLHWGSCVFYLLMNAHISAVAMHAWRCILNLLSHLNSSLLSGCGQVQGLHECLNWFFWVAYEYSTNIQKWKQSCLGLLGLLIHRTVSDDDSAGALTNANVTKIGLRATDSCSVWLRSKTNVSEMMLSFLCCGDMLLLKG